VDPVWTETATNARAQVEKRVADARASAGYAAYRRASDAVLRMKDRTVPPDGRPSDYWLEELVEIEYMFDASPLVIDRLRHHTHLVTGIRPYDYRTGKDPQPFAEKLAALRALGSDDLLVPESPLLGGFGFELDGALYNIDTLKYFEALIAMEIGGVVGAFRDSADRRVVCEIGPGWGGFPYQFKTLFPNTTYVLVDLPELFLYSATYLETTFPGARTLYVVDAAPEPDEWLEADFVFVPNTALDLLRPPRLDLTVNMVSFQEMTAAQVEEYARLAHELGSPYVYSLNRERSFYNDQIESVTEILGRYYWNRIVPVLPVGYTKMLPPKKKQKAARSAKERLAALEYTHVIGTRRIIT
jgi:hypothetical protein